MAVFRREIFGFEELGKDMQEMKREMFEIPELEYDGTKESIDKIATNIREPMEALFFEVTMIMKLACIRHQSEFKDK